MKYKIGQKFLIKMNTIRGFALSDGRITDLEKWNKALSSNKIFNSYNVSAYIISGNIGSYLLYIPNFDVTFLLYAYEMEDYKIVQKFFDYNEIWEHIVNDKI